MTRMITSGFPSMAEPNTALSVPFTLTYALLKPEWIFGVGLAAALLPSSPSQSSPSSPEPTTSLLHSCCCSCCCSAVTFASIAW